MKAKIAILCAIFSTIDARALWSGVSNSARTEDGHGNYAYNYGIANGAGASNSMSEVGDTAGNKRGAYIITDTDGRSRRVDYVADALGFRAYVNTNEPGTALSAPASATINSPYSPPVAPAVPATSPLFTPHGTSGVPSISPYSTVLGHHVPILGRPVYGHPIAW